MEIPVRLRDRIRNAAIAWERPAGTGWPRYRLSRQPVAGMAAAMGSGRRPALSCVAMNASPRSEEHTSELQSLMRSSYAVFCLKKKKQETKQTAEHTCNNS